MLRWRQFGTTVGSRRLLGRRVACATAHPAPAGHELPSNAVVPFSEAACHHPCRYSTDGALAFGREDSMAQPRGPALLASGAPSHELGSDGAYQRRSYARMKVGSVIKPARKKKTTAAADGAEKKAKGETSIEELYKKKTPVEHILLRPDTYVGSTQEAEQELWVFDEQKGYMKQRSCRFVPGLYKIFDEILVNASDNRQRDPKGMTEIKVTVDAGANKISVYNDGQGIPVVKHSTEGIYIPEMVLGHLLTGSNFDDSIAKVTGGRNGYGAKLTNIFSTAFEVETLDTKRGFHYHQSWANNMSEMREAVVTPIDVYASNLESAKDAASLRDFTRVTFSPDLSKFGRTTLRDDDILDVVRTRVCDLAGCNEGIKVTYNDTTMPGTFESYMNLYLHHTQKTTGEDPIFVRVNDRWQIGVGLSENYKFQQVSFVNSINTLKGGTHVNYIADQICTAVGQLIDKKDKQTSIVANHVKHNLFLFVNSLIENPTFDSQVKETLTTKASKFGSKCQLPESFIKRIVNETSIGDRVSEWARITTMRQLNKAGSKKMKKQIYGIPKLEDAEYAGGAKSDECSLILTEGDSAKALAVAGMSVIGRKQYGVYPLRGKFLNVRFAKQEQLLANKEVTELATIMGLDFNRTYDERYTEEECASAGGEEGEDAAQKKEGPKPGDLKPWNTRYSKVILMTDQDHDGSHIKGLVINFIHHFWPALLRHGFLQEFVTPIVKATQGKQVHSFFTIPEYLSWRNTIDNVSRWKIKYYKGLGTNTSTEGKEYFKDLPKHLKQLVWTEDADEAIDMAFNKDKATERKTWLTDTYTDELFIDHTQESITFTDFINKELILFSNAHIVRSIPSVVDGLKPAQRKVLYACLKRKLNDEIKLAQLAGYVGEHTSYHHSESSLHSTIINMAQNYVGSNNVPYLLPIGQFGTRLEGGSDHASPRYIFTKLHPLTRCLFKESDEPLLKFLEDDGSPIEPAHYVPVIPTVLVNGASGIGTGWATSVPCYNPHDIIANVERRLDGEEMQPMLPYYAGFRGEVTEGKAGVIDVKGVVEEAPGYSLRITELPVGKWTNRYKEFLEDLVTKKAGKSSWQVKSFSANHTDTVVDFTVKLGGEKSLAKVMKLGPHSALKLSTTLPLSNMHLFDVNGNIKKYESPLEIIEDFFGLRLDYYHRRKEHVEGKLGKDLVVLDNKYRFCEGVATGKLQVVNKPKAEVIRQLQEKGLGMHATGSGAESYDYLLSTSLMSLTSERLERLAAELAGKKKDLEDVKATTAEQWWKKDLSHLSEELRRHKL